MHPVHILLIRIMAVGLIATITTNLVADDGLRVRGALYADGAPLIAYHSASLPSAVADRAHERIRRPYFQGPLFVFEEDESRLRVCPIQQREQLDHQGLWLSREACTVVRSRLICYPKSGGVVSKVLNALWGATTPRKWHEMRSGQYMGYPVVESRTDESLTVLCGLGLLSGESTRGTRWTLRIERPERFELYAFFTAAELEDAEALLHNIQGLVLPDYTLRISAAKSRDERHRARITLIRRLEQVRRELVGVGFVDVTELDNWIAAAKLLAVRSGEDADGSLSNAEMAARRQWRDFSKTFSANFVERFPLPTGESIESPDDKAFTPIFRYTLVSLPDGRLFLDSESPPTEPGRIDVLYSFFVVPLRQLPADIQTLIRRSSTK